MVDGSSALRGPTAGHPLRWPVVFVLLQALGCKGAPADGGDHVDSGVTDSGTGDAAIYPQTGSYPTTSPVEIEFAGGLGEPLSTEDGEPSDDWLPSFSAVVHSETRPFPLVGLDSVEQCWSFVFITDDLTDTLGDSLEMSLGSQVLAMESLAAGIYVTDVEDEEGEAIESERGTLTFGGESPGIRLPEPFELHDRLETWTEVAEVGTLSLSWTPGQGDPNSYIFVWGLGNEHPDLGDEENVACALEDDGSAIIELGRPRPDLALSIGRAQSAVFDSDYGVVHALLYDQEVFVEPR